MAFSIPSSAKMIFMQHKHTDRYETVACSYSLQSPFGHITQPTTYFVYNMNSH